MIVIYHRLSLICACYGNDNVQYSPRESDTNCLLENRQRLRSIYFTVFRGPIWVISLNFIKRNDAQRFGFVDG